MFGLEELPNPNGSQPPFLRDRSLLLVNARSGISLIIARLTPPQTWMPSFLCESMLDAVDERITTLRFYDVGHDLAVRSSEWIESVKHGDLVVIVDYFGFPAGRAVAAQVRERGAWIIEDACQALLSDGVGECADFIVYSPRKFVGVPDGGILTVQCDLVIADLVLEKAPDMWWIKAFAATLRRREFDRHGGDRHWFDLFQQAENEQPIGPYAMSELSTGLLVNAFDYRAIAHRRRENYQYLDERLRELAIFQQLPDGVVPLGYPVRVHNRDRIRHTLFADGIYPPVHWPVPAIVPEPFRASRRLAEEIMTLPCDQRYGEGEMEKMVARIRENL